jgi:hypothetical protein
MRIKNIKKKLCDIFILQNLKKIKFNTERIFFLKSKKECVRGNHAHRECTQIFLSVKGNIELLINNKNGTKKILLKQFVNILKVPPLNWVTVKMKKDQLLMVLCDKKFSNKEYIKKYDEFLKIIK